MRLTPEGRKAVTTRVEPVKLEVRADGFGIAGKHGTVFPLHGRLSRRKALKVDLAWLPPFVPSSHLSTLADLAASGAVLLGPPDPRVAAPIYPSTPDTTAAIEAASVATRRAVWTPRTVNTPVSALLCSNRPDRVRTALEQLGRQSHTPLQVVLVLHGITEDDIDIRNLSTPPADLVKTTVPASTPFGAALTAGAQLADGVVVTKVDDDDYYGPAHISDVLIARSFTGAQLIGKALQYIYLEAIDVSLRQDGTAVVSDPEAYGTWTCGGTITVDRSIGDELGWFDAVPRAVDRNLQDKVLRAGGRIYRTHGLDYLYVRHGDGHTYATAWPKYLRNAIEQRRGPWPATTTPPLPQSTKETPQ